jgi:hypothetical protein
MANTLAQLNAAARNRVSFPKKENLFNCRFLISEV